MRQPQHLPALDADSKHPARVILKEDNPLACIHDPDPAAMAARKELHDTMEVGQLHDPLPHPPSLGAPAPVEMPEMERKPAYQHGHDKELPVLGPHDPHVPVVLLTHACEQPDRGELLDARVEHHEVRLAVVVHHPVDAAVGVRRVAHPAQHRHHELVHEPGFREDAPLPRARGEDAEARPVHEVADEEHLEGDGGRTRAGAVVVDGDQGSADVGAFVVKLVPRNAVHED